MREKGELESIESCCSGCMNYKPLTHECKAFTDPFPVWNKKPDTLCWARKEDGPAYRQMIQDMLNYAIESGSNHTGPLEKEMEKIIKAQDKDVASTQGGSFKNEFPWISGGGGGEKAEAGSMFGKETLKDNRFMHRKYDPKREDWNE